MTILVNGVTATRCSISLPRVGVWHADVELDATTNLDSAVTLTTENGALSLKGTVLRQGVFEGSHLSARLIGGAGGLSKALPPIAYRDVTVRLVARDLCVACGERLSDRSDAAVMGVALAKWIRVASTGAQALAQLLREQPASFRILPDGTLWIGADTYPDAPAANFTVLDRRYDEGRLELGCDQPFLLPGTTLPVVSNAGTARERVSYVVHTLEGTKIRSVVWLETGSA